MRKLTIFIIAGLLLAGCGPAEKKTDQPDSTFEFNYRLYADVLEKYTDYRTVDYAALKSNRTDLDNLIDQLAQLPLEEYDRMDDAEQLAFWINAYNALLLRTVVDAYPVASVKDIEGAMDDARWEITGKTIALDNIRDDILRDEYEDARILLALSCAANDGPPLFPEPFNGRDIDDQLDSAVYLFVNDVDLNTINPHEQTIITSEIFSWYGDDFSRDFATDDFDHLGQNERAVLNFIFTFVDESVTEFIDEQAEWQIEYRLFDWSLNDIKK